MKKYAYLEVIKELIFIKPPSLDAKNYHLMQNIFDSLLVNYVLVIYC